MKSSKEEGKSRIAQWCDDITNCLTSKHDRMEYIPLSDHLTRVEQKVDVILFVVVFVILTKSLGFVIGIIIALLDVLMFGIY